MKLFTVWGVVLFWGFLSLSVGMKMEAILCVVKKQLEEVLASALSMSNMMDGLTGILNMNQDGGKSASSSSTTCEFKEPPKVKVFMNPNGGLEAKINLRLLIIISNPETTIDVNKNCSVNFTLANGFKVENCSCSPSHGELLVKSKQPLLSALNVEDIIQPYLKAMDDKMCPLIQTAFEGLAGQALSKGLQTDTDVCVKNTMEDKDIFCYLMEMSKNGKGKHCTEGEPFWRLKCQLGKKVLIHVLLNSTDMARPMQQLLSEEYSAEGSEIAGVRDIRFMDGPEGRMMSYSTDVKKCNPEDQSECKTHSVDCSTDITIATEGKELAILPTTKGCDKEIESEQHADNHELKCCEMSSILKNFKMPLPVELGPMMDIQIKNCGDLIHMEISIPMLTDRE